ncbi:MAG: TPM domain-containing protein [Thermoguttaceae bacterium]
MKHTLAKMVLAIMALAAVLLGDSAASAAIPSDVLLKGLRPQGLVNDYAGVLAPADRAALEDRLTALQQKTSAEFAVVILKSLEGGEVNDFTNKLFVKWGVGLKGKNNGVMLLVAMQDHKARVEVGNGLEPVLPDALAGRVLDEQLFPAFKQQRYAEGLSQAAGRIAEIIERNEPATAEQRRGRAAQNVPPRLSFYSFRSLLPSDSVALGPASAADKPSLLFGDCSLVESPCSWPSQRAASASGCCAWSPRSCPSSAGRSGGTPAR